MSTPRSVAAGYQVQQLLALATTLAVSSPPQSCDGRLSRSGAALGATSVRFSLLRQPFPEPHIGDGLGAHSAGGGRRVHFTREPRFHREEVGLPLEVERH
jgi:hypothetical protein